MLCASILLGGLTMFFLRCAFWLSIVYASMSWTPGTLAPVAGMDRMGPDLIAAGRSQAQALVETAKIRVAAYCAEHARACLDDAARLTSLVAASDASDDADAGASEVTATIPLPVPDPRRHPRDLRDAKPAHIP